MEAFELSIPGVWQFSPVLRPDDRGVFLESFKADVFRQATGRDLTLKQANISVSREGTVRGVHFAQVPPGQAKYVQCLAGSILDIVVDIRVGSPTFGQCEAVRLDDRNRAALFVSEGLGHAFCALSESATISYLCSEGYAPTREFGVNPLDPELDLPWPKDLDVVLSAKDAAAPSLREAAAQNLLPTFDECERWYRSLETN